MPLVLLGESSGARMPDRMGAAGRAILAQDPTEYQRLRESPWVSALLGQCYGSSTWYSAMSDFVVMRKGAVMAVASPNVTSIAIGKPIDPEELGGWKLLTGVSGPRGPGRGHRRAGARRGEAVPLLPAFAHAWSRRLSSPCRRARTRRAGRSSRSSRSRATRCTTCARSSPPIADKDSSFELKERFGRSVATVLARLDGRSVGFIANNPMFKGGALDPDACQKATSFMVLCDSFNIPIVFLVDVPGFLIGVEGELRGMPGKIINWMNAISLVTVPKITIILRKSYGQAYINMGGGRNSDEIACWPTADLGFMDPRVSVNVLYGVKEEDDPERFKQLVAEVDRDTTPWELARLYEAQYVLDPRDTRNWLIRVLEVHRMRLTRGVGQHRLANWPTSY